MIKKVKRYLKYYSLNTIKVMVQKKWIISHIWDLILLPLYLWEKNILVSRSKCNNNYGNTPVQS